MSEDVLLVIGAGRIGQAIARRQGAGKCVVLVDFNEDTLNSTARALRTTGTWSRLSGWMFRLPEVP